jgi:Flp pilus assembly protein TadD
VCRWLFALALVAACDRRAPPVVDPLETVAWDPSPLDWSLPLPPAETTPEGYVGSAACARCHAAIAKSYARHSMARSGLRPVSSIPGMAQLVDSATESRHEKSGLSYRPVRHGARYFVEERYQGELLQTQPITHALSAGSYGLAFYFRQGKKLFQAPIDYYPQVKRWGMDPGDVAGNPRFTKALGSFCISCHSDYPRRRGEQGWLDPLPSEIGCERCHGPGKKHVASLRKQDIVNPARLPAARQMDVCAQCHLSSVEERRALRHEHDFRPGMRLDDVRVNFLAEADPGRLDLLSHTERLVRSACWRGGKLTCTTCHDPHTSSLEEPAGWWDQKCAQCHACSQKQTAGCPSCHMRKGPPWNPPQVTVTDHWIQRRPPPLQPERPAQKALRAWPSVLGETPSGPDFPSLEVLALAHSGQLAEAERRAPAAIADWPELPSIYSWLSGRYLSRHKLQPAVLASAMALRMAPDDRGALLQFARLQLDANHAGEAMQAIDRLIALDAEDADALELKGMLALGAGQTAEAAQLFTRAAAAGPSVAAAHVGLAVLAKDDKQRASELQKAHALEPRDSWILQKLGRPVAVQERSAATAWLPPAYQ